MIRKLGSMVRLARRNSLAGITSLFKVKEKKEKEMDGDGKKNKNKGVKAEASVSHVTTETDCSNDWSPTPGMEGLSLAAEIARRYTLKSNAEAAARLKQQQEQAAAAALASASSLTTSSTLSSGVSQEAAWDRNTTSRHGGMNGGPVREDGVRIVVEDDSDEDEPLRRRVPGAAERKPGMDHDSERDNGSGSDEDSNWRRHGGEDDDEDVTIRVGSHKNTLGEIRRADDHSVEEDDVEPWAVDVRRSVERTRKPSKGILKCMSLTSTLLSLSDMVWQTLRRTLKSCAMPRTPLLLNFERERTLMTQYPILATMLGHPMECHLPPILCPCHSRANLPLRL